MMNIAHLFQGKRDALPDEVDSVLLHVLADLVGHLLIEAAKQDRPHHDGRFQTLNIKNQIHY